MLTEVLLSAISAIVESISVYLLDEIDPGNMVKQWLGREPQRLALQIALTRAYTAFAAKYPEWTAAFFDEYFLKHKAAPILAQCLHRDGLTKPEALVMAWVDQLGQLGDTRPKQIAELTPVALDFLKLLNTELRARSELEPLFNSQTLEATHEVVRQIAESAKRTSQTIEALQAELKQALTAAQGVVVSGDHNIVIGHGAKVNVYHHYYQTAPPTRTRSKFLIPFPRNLHFVGRNNDLERLHITLQKSEAVGVRPAMLSGMAGIGKTQLVVEYAYRFQKDYPDGVYWVNAAQDWQDELASLAESVGLRADNVPESDRRRQLAQAFADFLNTNADALLIFDNVEDPRMLRTPTPGFIPTELKSHLLFTTRRRDPDLPFESIEVRVLPEPAALELLLHTEARREMLVRLQASINDPEIDAARAICRSLGYLPLALELAAVYLGKYHSISVYAYLKRLEKEGGLATVDASGVDPLDLATRHSTAVAATLSSQWEALKNENARHVLQTASLLSEASQIPRARLTLLTGLSAEGQDGYPSALDEALVALNALSLIEELTEHEIRLHPLIRQFAESTIISRPAFAQACVKRLTDALWDCDRLQDEVKKRGLNAVLLDLYSGLKISPNAKLTTILRIIQLESHHLHNWNSKDYPSFFIQQLRNRCLDLNFTELQKLAETKLAEWRRSYLSERFPVTWESKALICTLEGHSKAVHGVSVTPDARFAVSASADFTIIVWDLQTKQSIRTLKGHTDTVWKVAVTPDGRLGISASADRTLKVWEISTGRALQTLQGHTDKVKSVTITTDSRLGISGSDDCTLKVWDLINGQCIQTLTGHTESVVDVAITPDNCCAVSASRDKTLRVWNLKHAQAVTTLKGHDDWVTGVAITSDGRLAISSSRDRTLIIWDLTSGKILRRLRRHTNCVNGVAITSDDRFAISASNDYSLIIWDLKSGQSFKLKSHANSVNSVTTIPGKPGRYIASSASNDRTIKLWKIVTTKLGKWQPSDNHELWIAGVAITPDDRFVISASGDKTLKIWDIITGKSIRTFKGHTDKVTSIKVTPDGRFAVSTSQDSSLIVWDIKSGQFIRKLKDHADWVNSVAVTPDGRLAISASKDCTLKIWELATGQVIKTLEEHSREVRGVAITPDGRFAISSSRDQKIIIWDIDVGRVVNVLQGHTDVVWDVAVAPKGDIAVSASADKTIKVWNLVTGQFIKTLEGHERSVTTAKITSDGRFVVSSSADLTLRVWDLVTGKPILILATSAPFWGCDITRDNRQIIAGDSGGAIHFIEWVKGEDRGESHPQVGLSSRTA